MDANCEIIHSNGFYEDAAKYWEAIPATVNGMLGGFGFISRADIEGSDRFLNRIFEVNKVKIFIKNICLRMSS